MSNEQAQVTIRAVRESDYSQWLQLWLAYQDFYQVKLSEEVNRTTFQRILDSDEPVFSAIAVHGDKLIGMVNYVIHRSTWSQTNYCYLEDLYVSPEIRSKGTGKQLIEWVKSFAQQNQCTRLYWNTQETNSRAQRLYNWITPKSGFISYRIPL